VSVGSQLGLGVTGNTTGTIDVSGVGSEFRITGNGSLATVGVSGTGIVTVSAGGLFTAAREMVIANSGTSQGTMTIQDAGSSFEVGEDNASNDDSLLVGATGAGTLAILDGATARIERMVIGGNGNTGDATVDSENTPGASLEVNGELFVGNGTKGTLSLKNGALLDTSTSGNFAVFIGNTATGDGSAVLVDDSTWNHMGTGLIGVGYGSNSNTDVASSLTIRNGGGVTASDSIMLVADLGGSNGNLVVQNPGSSLTVGRLLMGDNGAGTAAISDGASLVVSGSAGGNLEVSAFGGGSGSMTVTDPGTTVTVADYLSVGDEGTANGDLTIDNGASVSTTTGNVYIARTGSTSQGLVVVQDLDTNDGSNGSTLSSGSELFVGGNAGGAGGDGQLDVNASGTVNIANSLEIWYNGTVNLNGGTINANDLNLADAVSPPFAAFNWISGTFQFTTDRNLNVTRLSDLLGAAPTLVGGQTLVVSGIATLSAPLRLNGGALTVGSVFSNDTSNLSFDAGTFNLTSANLNVGTGGLFGSSLLIESDQVINVANQATINAGAELVVAGGFSSGGLTNDGELVAIDTTIGGPVVNNNNFTVVGTVDFDGLVSGPGAFFGPGTANFNGGMAPGASPAEVSFEGNVALADTNTLFIEIAGTTPGTEYDRLMIAGNASLNGILDVSLIDAFVPTAGQQFAILTANNIVDNGLALGGTAASSFSLLVSNTSVILQAIAPGVPGDYNQNGVVDAADYVVWRKTDGTPAGYNTWRANFGRTVGTGAGASASASVPEPTTLVMLIVAAVGIRLCGRETYARVPSTH
jgi:T5SS/PEP-CTERM-associated repeat protein